jgi:integrase
LQTQFPAGETVPFALHQEVQRLLAMPAPAPEGRTLGNVMDRYERGHDFTRLKPRTQSDYVKLMRVLRDQLGHLEPRHIERRHVIAWRDSWAKKSGHAANARVQMLKTVLEKAIDYGLLPAGANPAKGVGKVRYERRERQPWPQDLVQAARETATGRPLLLLELCLGTGQRIGDVLKMKWGDYDGQAINVNQNKTGAALWVPVTRELRAALDAAPRRSVFILTNERATAPWSYRGAFDAMMKLRRAIGAEAYDIHSLRYTATAELAALGLDDDTIRAITGHRTGAMVAHYAGPARQRARAMKAQQARDAGKEK